MSVFNIFHKIILDLLLLTYRKTSKKQTIISYDVTFCNVIVIKSNGRVTEGIEFSDILNTRKKQRNQRRNKMKKIIISAILSLTMLFGILAPVNTEASTKTISTAESIILEGTKYIGTKYRYGGTTPSGFDCSGFVGYTYKKVTGKTLPRTSKGLYSSGTSIKKNQLQKGDILVFNTSGKGASHVAIYIGDNKFIHSASKGVRIDSLSNSYWGPKYMGAKRYL